MQHLGKFILTGNKLVAARDGGSRERGTHH